MRFLSDMQPILPEHPYVRAALWHLDGLRQEGMSPDIWLTKQERAGLEGLAHERRRNEWTASRIALKRLLVSEGIIRSPLNAEIRKNAKGRPDIVVYVPDTGHYEEIPCSIAHKNRLVLVAFSRGGLRIGVDIEKRSWRLSRLRGKFISSDDHMLIERDSIGECTVLWTLKEAVSKLLGTGFACGFPRIKCRETSPGICEVVPPDGDTVFFGQYLFFPDKYAISVVTDFAVPPSSPDLSRVESPAVESGARVRRSWYEQLSRARRLKKLRRARAFASLHPADIPLNEASGPDGAIPDSPTEIDDL